MPIYNGSQKINPLYVGAQKIREAWHWTGSAWQQLYSAAVAMGMDKSGTQSCPTSWVQVTGWAVRSGYPGTVIASNALVAAGAATVTVYGKITISGGTLPAVTFRIKRNGTVIYTSSKSGSTQSGSVSVALAAGDVLTMEAESSTYAGTPTIQAGATNTYLYFDL